MHYPHVIGASAHIWQDETTIMQYNSAFIVEDFESLDNVIADIHASCPYFKYKAIDANYLSDEKILALLGLSTLGDTLNVPKRKSMLRPTVKYCDVIWTLCQTPMSNEYTMTGIKPKTKYINYTFVTKYRKSLYLWHDQKWYVIVAYFETKEGIIVYQPVYIQVI